MRSVRRKGGGRVLDVWEREKGDEPAAVVKLNGNEFLDDRNDTKNGTSVRLLTAVKAFSDVSLHQPNPHQ